MAIKEIVQGMIGFDSQQERELMELACNACEAISIDASQVTQMLSEATEQYKASEYNLLEKTIDSLARLVGLTTQPTDTNKLNISATAGEKEAAGILRELDQEIKTLLSQVESFQREKDDMRRDNERLYRELNEANEKLANQITKQNEREKGLISNLQRLLAAKGRAWEPSDEDPVSRIMDEYGLSVVWDCEAQADSFTRLIVSDPNVVGIKHPAMLKDGKLVSKGIIYALEEQS